MLHFGTFNYRQTSARCTDKLMQVTTNCMSAHTHTGAVH